VGLPEEAEPIDEKTQLIALAFRKLISEYVAAVHDTMNALHNRPDCTIETPCAYCRRRMKAEVELLSAVGCEPRSTRLRDELAARLCAADAGKPKM
jgi:hypothetical protein